MFYNYTAQPYDNQMPSHAFTEDGYTAKSSVDYKQKTWKIIAFLRYMSPQNYFILPFCKEKR